MRLNLKDIIHVPGATLPFSFSVDLSNEEFHGERPITEPLLVSGVVRNMAGALVLNAEAVTNLSLHCDRCVKPFRREKSVAVETLLATQLEDAAESDIELLDGTELDAGELMTTAFVLDMDTKNLCAPECKGLCPGCGADLNAEPCRCQREVDPRLAKLAEFLTQSEKQ